MELFGIRTEDPSPLRHGPLNLCGRVECTWNVCTDLRQRVRGKGKLLCNDDGCGLDGTQSPLLFPRRPICLHHSLEVQPRVSATFSCPHTPGPKRILDRRFNLLLLTLGLPGQF